MVQIISYCGKTWFWRQNLKYTVLYIHSYIALVYTTHASSAQWLLGLFLSLKCLAGSGRVLHSGRFDQFFVRFLHYSHWSESTGQKIVNWTTVHTLCTTTTSVHNEAVARLVTTYYYSRTGDVIRKTLGLSWPQKKYLTEKFRKNRPPKKLVKIMEMKTRDKFYARSGSCIREPHVSYCYFVFKLDITVVFWSQRLVWFE